VLENLEILLAIVGVLAMLPGRFQHTSVTMQQRLRAYPLRYLTVRYPTLRLAALAFTGLGLCAASAAFAQKQQVAIAIHGGAGVIDRAKLTPQREAAIRADLERAVRAGYAKLTAGASSVEAVSTAVIILEDSPYFNAGKGAVYTADRTHELDAAIMDGARRRAGAIAGVKRIKNPVLLARAVMEQSQHVLLTGVGAENFARSIGMKFVSTSYFNTPERLDALKQAQRLERLKPQAKLPGKSYFGTVGSVALDMQGRLAAATSTGGMTNKRFGRVGDAPLIGAGTFADQRCAVSATGHGEYFIRSVVAYDICARAQYQSQSVETSAKKVVMEELKNLGGEGGVITIDANGNISMPFNSLGMYRAAIDAQGQVSVEIF
jgi:L-asparaginase / beta-aspartyl-peptidase